MSGFSAASGQVSRGKVSSARAAVGTSVPLVTTFVSAANAAASLPGSFAAALMAALRMELER